MNSRSDHLRLRREPAFPRDIPKLCSVKNPPATVCSAHQGADIFSRPSERASGQWRFDGKQNGSLNRQKTPRLPRGPSAPPSWGLSPGPMVRPIPAGAASPGSPVLEESQGLKARPIRRHAPPLSTRCHRPGRQPSKEPRVTDPNREIARKDAKFEGKDEGRFPGKGRAVQCMKPPRRFGAAVAMGHRRFPGHRLTPRASPRLLPGCRSSWTRRW